jgi:hypothetical protein
LKISKRQKSQKDEYQFLSDVDGLYKLCFSNKMSTISHKVVYFDWVVGNEIDEIEGIFEHPNGANVRQYLNRAKTHHRLKEASGRRFAEALYTKPKTESCEKKMKSCEKKMKYF